MLRVDIESNLKNSRNSKHAGLDDYTDIEAATNPLILSGNNTGVLIAEPQVVSKKCLDGH